MRGNAEKIFKEMFDNPPPKPGLPESFKVLLRELRSLGLYPRVYDKNDHELDIA